MSSRNSSSSRDTVVHLLREEDGTFPATSERNEGSTKQSKTPNRCDSVILSSLQERRGRRNVTNSVFRPLSVFTKSVLVPFDQNFEKAFDVLKTDSPDRLKVASNILSLEREDSSSTEVGQRPIVNEPVSEQKFYRDLPEEEQETTDQQSQPQDRANNKLVTPERSIFDADMHEQKPLRDCEMDLMTALKVTSPEKDSTIRVSGEFLTLCELPVPDPSEHPAFTSNPFEVKTDAPLLFTPTSSGDIRAYSFKRHQNFESHYGNSGQGVERKKSLFGLGLTTPSSVKGRSATNPSYDLSFPILVPGSNTESACSSIKDVSPVTADLQQFRESVSIGRSSGVRKFSDLFKRKENPDQSEPGSPLWSPRTSPDILNLDRRDLEKYLRRTTSTPTYTFDPYSPYPRHPNTGRGWRSRNLKCTTCFSLYCAVCHRVCCAYRAAVLALDNRGGSSSGRPIALQRIQEITKLYPYGKESPTFLQCTIGAMDDEVGCGKMVCPDCCSICPDDACADTVCRKCKPAMWEECDWHKDGTLSFGKLHDYNDSALQEG